MFMHVLGHLDDIRGQDFSICQLYLTQRVPGNGGQYNSNSMILTGNPKSKLEAFPSVCRPAWMQPDTILAPGIVSADQMVLHHFSPRWWGSQACRSLGVPNAGGNSVLSEALSIEYMRRTHNVIKVALEMEVRSTVYLQRFSRSGHAPRNRLSTGLALRPYCAAALWSYVGSRAPICAR